MLKGLGKVLLAEGKLAGSPDLDVLYIVSVIVQVQIIAQIIALVTYGLQSLLDLSVEGTGLDSDDLGGGIGVVGDRRATLGAEDAVDSVAGRTLTSPALGGAIDGQLVLGHDGNES